MKDRQEGGKSIWDDGALCQGEQNNSYLPLQQPLVGDQDSRGLAQE